MNVIEINASWGCAPTIDLGQRGENLATEVRFDFSGWAEEFGAPGAVELYVRRAGETTPYPVALTIEDTVAVWPVSAIDTHIIGLGEAELVYLINGTVVKTAVYGTSVEPDIGKPDGTPPDPYETWMEALGEMAAGTLINAQRAETAQDGAEAAQTAAEAAQSAAETAQEASEAAQTGAEAAQTAAEAAQTAAEAAQTGAETAQTRAESAATNAANSASQSLDSATAAAASAATAQSAASTATQKATEAASSASSAATSASTATQKATAAANSATSAQNWALDAAQDATTAASASDDAQTYASNASASATAAAGSASAAAASASAAAASETAAGNSATAASASETAAEAAQAAAEAVLESIPPDYSTLSDDVDGLKSAFNNGIVPTDVPQSWEQGAITSSGLNLNSGTNYSKRVRTPAFYSAKYKTVVDVPTSYVYNIYLYNSAEITEEAFVERMYSGWHSGRTTISIDPSYSYFRIVVAYSDTTQGISPSDISGIDVNADYPTDISLSEPLKAADSKTAGDKINQITGTISEIKSNLFGTPYTLKAGYSTQATDNANIARTPWLFPVSHDVLITTVIVNVNTTGNLSYGVYDGDATLLPTFDATKYNVVDQVTFADTGKNLVVLPTPVMVKKGQAFALGKPSDTAVIGYKGTGEYGFCYINTSNQIVYAASTCLGVTIKGLVAQNGSIYSGKKVSIFGDSISTFRGWIPSGNTSYYIGTNADVPTAADTWWSKTLNALNAELLVNNSNSGRAVSSCRDGQSAHSWDAGYKEANALQLKSGDILPDVIIIKLGINDFNHGAYLGTYDGSEALPADPSLFTNAYAMMLNNIMTNFPLAEVFCCTLMPCESNNSVVGFPEINDQGESLIEWNDAIRKLAHAFGAKILDHDVCGITYYNLQTYMGDYSASTHKALHPNADGHSLIANQTIHDMDNAIRTRY